MRIVFTGGGTGGHFFPILAVAREVKRLAEEERILDIQLFYFGPEKFSPELLRGEDIIFSRIAAGKVRRYFSFRNFSDLLKVLVGVLQALWKMFIVMPDVVFAKGGFGSFPTLFAARLYRIPVIIHESDAVPGRVNQWAGRWARRIAISFPAAGRYFPEEGTALTGVPIRKRILGGDIEQARETFGVFSDRPVVFVTGGSQGAQPINRVLVETLAAFLDEAEIIHQVGESNFDDMRLETAPLLEGGKDAYYHLVAFLDEEKLKNAYRLADVVISRASSTIFEIAAAGKPAILIPLDHAAQDHQRKNAYAYASYGAAVVIEQDNLTPSVLLNEIRTLLADPERRARMSEAAKKFSRRDAAELIAKEILTLGLHE